MIDFFMKIFSPEIVRLGFVSFVKIALFNIMFFSFTDKLFERRYSARKYFVLFAETTIILTALYSIRQSWINAVVLIVYVLLITKVFYKTTYLQVLITEIVCIAGCYIATRITQKYWYGLSYTRYFEDDSAFFIYSVMSSVAIFAVYKVIFFLTDVIYDIKNKCLFHNMKLIFSLLETIISCYLAKYMLEKIRYRYNVSEGLYDIVNIIGILLLVLLIDVFITYSFRKIEAVRQYEKEILLINTQNQLQLDKYIALNNRYEANGKIIHDIKKHLDVLGTLIDSNNERAASYYKEMEKQISNLKTGFSCTHKILNIIMSQKIIEAENKGIKVNVDMVDVNIDIIKDIDVSAIFSNLWDNAIEAAVTTKDGVGYINVVIGQMMNFIVISFENSHNKSIKYENGRYKSSKGENHGLGLKIIKETVEKYNGQFDTEAYENRFVAKAIIPM